MLQTLANEVVILRRRLELLGLIREQEPIGIVQVSNRSGVPHQKVRYALHVLEDEGVIVPTQEGAKTTETMPDLVTAIDATVGEL